MVLEHDSKIKADNSLFEKIYYERAAEAFCQRALDLQRDLHLSEQTLIYSDCMF